jgi:hypothetical protein
MYNNFSRLKTFLFDAVHRLKGLIGSFSLNFFKAQYESITNKLHDLKGTNWELAQYHFMAGNFNDGIMRFKILQRAGYKVMEANYFLGRIYFEKNNYSNAKKYLSLYLESQQKEYCVEADYCMSIINNKEISSVPLSLIKQKRDRLALTIESAKTDQALLLRYCIIITALKSQLNGQLKVLEVGCYVGVFGRMFRECFKSIIQYYSGTEIGDKSAKVAQEMNIENMLVYDSLKTCNDIDDIAKDDNSYSLIIVPDIIRYFGDLMILFIQIFASLQEHGITAFVFRMIKNEKQFKFSHICTEDENTGIQILKIENNDVVEEDTPDEKNKIFIGVIEEFCHSPHYVKSIAISCGFNLKMSVGMPNDFALFVLQKP